MQAGEENPNKKMKLDLSTNEQHKAESAGPALLCQGAEGKLFLTEWLGRPAVCKNRFAKNYRAPALDAMVRHDRTRAEARGLLRLRGAGIRAPAVLEVDMELCNITMEYISNGCTLRDVIKAYQEQGLCGSEEDAIESSDSESEDGDSEGNDEEGQSEPGKKGGNQSEPGKKGGNQSDSRKESQNKYKSSKLPADQMDASKSLNPKMENLAVKVAETLAKMHKNNIIHGDLTTSNMMLVEPVEESDITVIDLGLSSFSESVEDKAVDLNVMERAILATHPNTGGFVDRLWEVYGARNGKQSRNVIRKLDEVRMRGRKKLCLG